MDTVVLGFDGREAAFIALDWVARRAAQVPSTVEFLTVGDALTDPMTRELSLQEAEQRIRKQANSAVITSRQVAGTMPHALVESSIDADLLVIGARRQRLLGSLLDGWLPLRLVAHSPIPTVIVPCDADDNSTGPVIVGVDDDDSSQAAIEFGAREATARGLSLLLIHVWRMPDPESNGAGAYLATPKGVLNMHRQVLREAGQRATTLGSELSVTETLVHDNPVSALLSAARNASLLVLGTHHRGLIEGAFLGSVAQDIIPQTPIPVCVAPTPSAR
jgi:nucleotide-binding universal stress UspA family protein